MRTFYRGSSRRTTRLLALLLGLALLPACEEYIVNPPGGDDRQVRGLKISEREIRLPDGDTTTIETVLVDGDDRPFETVPPDVRIQWSVADSQVVSVDSTGRVAALHPGETRVTAAVETDAGQASISADVTVLPVPAAIESVSGDDQTAPAGDTLPEPLVARVTDRHGDVIQGETVVWSVEAGGGSLDADTTVTDSLGHARVRWTLGDAARTQQVAARVDAGDPALVAYFTATTVPLPDLVPLDLSASPNPLNPGDTLVTRVYVRNAGTAPADSTVLAFRIVDAATGTQVAEAVRPQAPLDTAATTGHEASFLPDSTWPDRVVVRAVADPDDGMDESDEANNTYASAPIPVNKEVVRNRPRTLAAGWRVSCAVAQDGTAACWGDNSQGELGIGSTDRLASTPQTLDLTGVVMVSVGVSHACAVATDGQAYCWGANRDGQLGTGGDATPTAAPVSQGSAVFQMISAGRDHTCALDTDGQAYCWGGNDNGQLGDGGTTASPTPVAVSQGPLSFQEISVGDRHTCAVDTAGDVYCWGGNYAGQLGDGTTTEKYTPTPAAGADAIEFVALDAGAYHTCALDASGRAYCWGSANNGQVGDGSTSGAVTSPAAVSGGHTFRSIRGGEYHTCAVDTGGTLYCWGTDNDGQLGTATSAICGGEGAQPCAPTPGPVATGFSVAAVATGFNHTCAVDNTGAAYCWGGNVEGQLGNGEAGFVPGPMPVKDSRSYGDVTVGSSWYPASCGVDDAGTAYCWGSDYNGQLGTGSFVGGSITPVAVAGDHVVRTLSFGGSHACIVDDAGAAYCWGSNRDGQLGTGSSGGATATPTAVAGALTFGSVDAGDHHTCGLDDSGRAYCWGDNSRGQLGDSATVDGSSPGPVADGRTFRSISAGGYHTCAVDHDFQVFCWGNDDDDQLGGGGTEVCGWDQCSTTPVLVPGGHLFRSVTTGLYHTCAIDNNDQAYCWGRGTYGELGDGSGTDSATPVAVAGGIAFQDVDAGHYHTCGLDLTGQAYCWGNNDDGQLGTGSFSISELNPVPVAQGPIRFVALETGDSHTCAVATDGQAYCWGSNEDGQLGIGWPTARPTPVAVQGGLVVE